MSRVRVVSAFSAGGVVFRQTLINNPATEQSARAAIEVALVGYPRENIWTLPKGTPGPGETPEETALREVREETGLMTHILDALGSIHYWFSRRGVRYRKEVAYYLMTPIGGDLTLHDHEYDEARWFSVDEATRRLGHENEIAMVRRAESLINQLEGYSHAALQPSRASTESPC